MIKVENLTKRFGPTVAVNDVSFEVDKGEILGFLGPNGAGKSTTMRILTTYLIPDSGTAEIEGHDILTEPLEVRKKVGYLPESVPLYNEMHVDEYLTFIAKVRNIPQAQRKEKINSIIERVGLIETAKKACGHLSKGYRQRVGIAQALIHDPAVLVLDEPTSGLDPHQIIEIRDLIRDISKSKVVLFSTHILQEIEAICKRIIIINKGRIVANGTTTDLAQDVLGGIQFQSRVKGPVDEIKAGLNGLAGVRKATVSQQNGDVACSAVFDKTADPGTVFGDLAKEKGWSVLESTTEKSSLEDVYLAITEKHKGEDA